MIIVSTCCRTEFLIAEKTQVPNLDGCSLNAKFLKALSFPSRFRTSESDSLSWVNLGEFFILVKSGKSVEFSTISAGNDTERGSLLGSGGSSIRT